MVASYHKADNTKRTDFLYFHEYYLQLKPESMF